MSNVYGIRDIVRYDRVTTYGGEQHPYRSEDLFRQDVQDVMLSRWHVDYRERQVQVIVRHGDSLWTNVEYVRAESVGDFGMQRYVVTLPDGTEHKVCQDRIRLRPVK
jgi:hypothetical protein